MTYEGLCAMQLTEHCGMHKPVLERVSRENSTAL